MKTPITASKLIALVLVFLAIGVTTSQAIFIICQPSVGIALGQTLRVNILNLSERGIIIIGGKFLDEDGNALAEFRGSIEPRKTMSFDLNRDSLSRQEKRLQIHPVIDSSEAHLGRASISLEVFDNADGRTTVFIGNPDE